ncbi:hypothetical protein BMAGN_0084 [Bifidobacterium magnum]|uniref:Uncharacterized protein n=1 Tax=Bifidobacterium magnum TaxID=1692 RepID=A0A087BAT6_9BIFI|nr:hypothetical protein BMAGN_0084 [Bifidobacterium magnum]
MTFDRSAEESAAPVTDPSPQNGRTSAGSTTTRFRSAHTSHSRHAVERHRVVIDGRHKKLLRIVSLTRYRGRLPRCCIIHSPIQSDRTPLGQSENMRVVNRSRICETGGKPSQSSTGTALQKSHRVAELVLLSY